MLTGRAGQAACAKARAPGAIYVVASNPCDVLAQVVWAHLGLPRERVAPRSGAIA